MTHVSNLAGTGIIDSSSLVIMFNVTKYNENLWHKNIRKWTSTSQVVGFIQEILKSRIKLVMFGN